MRDSLWVLMNPDNNHWDSDFAREERARESRALFLYYNLKGGENNGFIRPR